MTIPKTHKAEPNLSKSSETPINETPMKGINIIEASAGTGKTHALTSIYLWQIINGVPIKKIVTLTYTNAATDEMRSRIKNQLYKLMAICKQLDIDEKMQEQTLAAIKETKDNLIACQLMKKIFQQKRQLEIKEIKTKIKLAIDEMEQAEISTFHSFCERISNFYALESGKIPNQKIGIAERPFIEGAAILCFREKYYSSTENTHPHGDVLYVYMASNFKPDSDKYSRYVTNYISYLKFIQTLINRPSLKIYPQNQFDEKTNKQKKDELQKQFNKCKRKDFDDFFEKNYKELDLLLSLELEKISLIVKKKSREEREKIRACSFNDLIVLCEELVQDEQIKKKINNRFEVLLVDEAQDCNERQLALLENFFPPQKKYIYYIGDTKQSIYSFQGANVYSFLERKKKASNIETLLTNYRSNEALLQIIHSIYRECDNPFYFEKDMLSYVETKAYKETKAEKKESDIGLTVFALDEKLSSPLNTEQRRTAILHKMAQDIIDQKNLGNDLSKMAVLVKKNKQIEEVAFIFDKYAIPFQKFIDNQSVLLRPACKILSQFLICLESMDLMAMKALLIELLYNFPIDELKNNDENILNYFASLKQHLRKNGIFSTIIHMLNSPAPNLKTRGILRRGTITFYLLQREGGQTLIEDLKFLAEILGSEEKDIKNQANSFRLKTSGTEKELIKRLNILYKKALSGENIHCKNNEGGKGIIILTIHKSKGLEYDHVYLPLQTCGKPLKSKSQIFYKQNNNQQDNHQTTNQKTDHKTDLPKNYQPYLCLSADSEQKNMCFEETKKEEARLLYVALTRAKKKVSLFFCSNDKKNKKSAEQKNFNHILPKSCEDNATYHLFFANSVGNIRSREKIDYLEKLKEKSFLKNNNASLKPFTLEEVERNKNIFLQAETTEKKDLDDSHDSSAPIKKIENSLSNDDHLSVLEKITMRGYIESFTSLNKKLNLSKKKVGLSLENDESDETEEQETTLLEPELEEQEFSFWALPSSAKIGKIFHEIIEGIEFDQVTKETHKKLILQRISNALKLENIDQLYSESFYEAILAILNYPIARGENCHLPDDFSLAKIPREDTLTEATFFYPCSKPLFGEENIYSNNPSFRETPPTDLLSTIAREFNKEGKQKVTTPFNFQHHNPTLHFEDGHIKGVIDLVFRYKNRYFLLDWKTNKLGNQAKDYSGENIEKLMMENAYTLQGKLYLIALHRLIKQRMGESYNPNLHLGGVFFFFVRGAVFQEEATKCIYYFNLMKEQIEELEKNFCATTL